MRILLQALSELRTSAPLNNLCLMVCFACACLFTSACKYTETPAEIAAREKILLLGNGTEPKGLDPHLATGVPESNIITSLLEGLVAYHPTNDLLVLPGVAHSWESNDENTVWRFHLRKDAQWSNGDTVTAHDFVYAAKRMLTPELGANYADLLYILSNGEAYHTGCIEDFSKVGVRAPDDHTLEYELLGPIPYFLSMLTHYAWFPVHPPTIERHGGIANRDAAWTRVEHFVGNGPFRLTNWKTNSFIEVERSPTYWDSKTLGINGIRFFPIERPSTEEAAFRAGQLHYCSQVPLDRIDHYRKNEAEKMRLDPYFGTYYYRFNTTLPPLDNPLVRLALSLSIDREAIVRQITRGDETPASAFVYHGIADYASPDLVKFDPVLAREKLAKAGFPDGRGFPRNLEILFNTQEAHRVIAEAIQQMWKQHLGIEVGLINQEWKVYLDTQQSLQYSISRSGWIGDFIDPMAFLMLFTSNSGNNQTGWANPEYDRLFREVKQTGDPAKRFRLMEQMERLLLEEAPIAPIYWYTRKYLIDPRVKGWHPKLLDQRPYKLIDFHDS